MDQAEYGGQAGAAISALLKEIEERKAVEAELRQANDELEELYTNTECGYHSLDSMGTVVKMNDIELFWLGYRREDVIGKMKLTQFLSPECHEKFKKVFDFLLEHGWVRQFQCDMLRKDGSTFPIMANVRAIHDEEGNFLRSSAAIFDVSERQRVETELHKRNEMLEQSVSERTSELRMTHKILEAEMRERKLAEASAMDFSNRLQDMTRRFVDGQGGHESLSRPRRLRFLQFSRK